MINYINSSVAQLVEFIIQRKEGSLTNNGMISVNTGKHTGRAANDKFIVFDSLTEHTVDWSTNQKLSVIDFNNLWTKMLNYMATQQGFHQDLYAGVGDNKLMFALSTTTAWHALFAKTMFYSNPESSNYNDWSIIHAPDFLADPSVDHTNSETFIIISFARKVVLIGGTHYAGEIKKSVFTILNFLLPDKGVLPMHSSVNTLDNWNDSAIFFGLSGTGKTTLSADPHRTLIGDDEHGWNPDGTIFNFEDGCYAKAIKLSYENEPQIWNAVHNFGTILENVKVVGSSCDFSDSSLTENTRAAYKLANIVNSSKTRQTNKPEILNIFMLACDAYGILPPLSKLTPAQAAYYFLSGYTAKVAGTEAGIKEPKATFSACFGAPFLPRHPVVYANMLVEKINQYGCDVWLLNTGWVGGPYGVGQRIDLKHTRKLIEYALYQHSSEVVSWEEDPIFGLTYLTKDDEYITSDSVPLDVLKPELAWKKNLRTDYLTKAQELANKFKDNFKKYEDKLSLDILKAGPK